MIKLLPIVLLAGCMCSCAEVEKKAEQAPEKPARCELVDDGGSTMLYIYRVDNHEYIATNHGGILHSESCPCRKGKEVVINGK